MIVDAVNAGVDEQLFTYIDNSIRQTPFYQLLGLELKLMGPGYVELEVKPTEKHTNALNLVQGGLIMTIGDAAMGNAIRSLGIKGVTVDCSVSFPGAAQLSDTVIAQGKVLKAGRNMIFAEALVYANDQLVGQCKASFFKVGDIEL